MNSLSGRVAVITGGSRGLGFSIAQAYVREGAAVAIASRNEKNIETALVPLRAGGGRASGIPCDITDLEQVGRLAQYALEQFGGLDIWVNNAGLSCPMGPTIHIPPPLVTSLIQTNVLGVYHGSWVAMQHFLRQGKGKLINLIGRGAHRPVPLQNPYASSKAWVCNFTRALVKEYRSSGVGIYLLNPGLVETDMMSHLSFIRGFEANIRVFRIIAPLFSNPPEVAAEKAIWLASPASDGRTGLEIDLISNWAMLKGLFRAAARRLTGRPGRYVEPEISLVEPALELPAQGVGARPSPAYGGARENGIHRSSE